MDLITPTTPTIIPADAHRTLGRGIIPPMVTPLRSRDELDEPGLANLTEHILAGGVHGLFVLGTTGEGPSLSHRLQREVVKRVCEQVAGRVPVLVGITDTSFTEQVELARWSADRGTDALVLAPPYYFPAGQPELREYLASLIPELPLPLFLYNMPAMTKLTFEVDTVLAFADDPKVVGLKDSSGDMVYFHKLVRAMAARRPGFRLLVGPEELLAEAVLLGAHGGVCGGANLFPGLYVELYEAAQARDVQRVASLHEKVMRISSSLYGVGRHPSRTIKGIKCGLSVMGVCSDEMADPFHRFHEAERTRIEQHLTTLRAQIA